MRGFAWSAAALFALTAAAAIGAIALTQSESGRRWISGLVAEVAGAASGWDVRIDGLGAGLPSRIAIDRLTIADETGVWFAAERLDITWRPRALLGRRIDVTDAAATSLTLWRLPAASAEDQPVASQPWTPPEELPLGVRVGALAIDRLDLGAGVIGEAAQFRVAGALGATRGAAAETRLDIARLDGPAASLRLDARWTAERRLRLDGRLEESGALATALAGAPIGPSVVTLAGDGPLEDWRGAFAVGVDHQVEARADLALALGADGAAAIEADGDGSWLGPAPAAMAPALRSPIAFSTRAARAADGALTLERFTASTPDLVVSATGGIDSDGQVQSAAVLEAKGRAFAADALGGWTVEAIDARIRAAGPTDALAFEADGEVRGLAGAPARVGTLSWRARAEPETERPDPQGTRFALDVVARDWATPEPSAVRAVLGPAPKLSAQGVLREGDRLELASASLDGAAARATASGVLAFAGGRSDAEIAIEAPDLAKLGAAAPTGLVGSATARATVTGDIAGTIAADLRIAADRLDAGTPALSAALGRAPTLTAAIRLVEGAGLAVDDLRLTAAHLRGEGRVAIDAAYSTLDGEVRLDAPSLAPIAAANGTPATGRARFDATLAGPLADPRINATLKLADAAFGGVAVDSAVLTAALRDVATGPNGPIALDASVDRRPLLLRAQFDRPAGTLARLSAIEVDGFGARVTGDLVAAPGGVFAGDLAANTAGWRDAGTLPIVGPLRGHLRLTPEGARQAIDARIDGGPLVLADAGVEVGLLRGSLHVVDAFGSTPQLSLDARAQALKVGDSPPTEVTLAVSGPIDGATAALSMAASGAGQPRLSARAILARRPAGVFVRLDELNGVVTDHAISLLAPVEGVAGDGGVRIGEAAVAVGTGRALLQAELRPGILTRARVAFEAFPLGVAEPWIGPFVRSGRLDGVADLDTRARAVTGRVNLQVSGLRAESGAGSDASLDATFDGTLDNGGFSGSTQARGAGGALEVRANFSAPAAIAPGELAPSFRAAAPLRGSLDATADLARLAAALAPPDQRFAGALLAHFNVGGVVNRPSIDGDATLTGGLYENYLTGTLITGVEARAHAAGTDQVDFQLTGASGRGALDVEGAFRPLAAPNPDATPPQLAITVRADNADLVQRDDVAARLDARLAYRGGLASGRISGEIQTDEVEIRLSERLPPEVVRMQVREINRPGGALAVVGTTDAPSWRGDIDVALAMPARVFVRGRGVQSEWKGDLAVFGHADEPRLRGNVELVRGDVNFGGKKFTLTRGAIRFSGSSPPDPTIDLAAQYRAAELTAFITITGLASNPTVEMSSQPPLPRSEVLSQVLFGRSTTKLSPIQAIQLASALDTLARGESVSENVMGFARTLLGLDVLSIDPGASEGSSAVTAGAYLGDGLYVGATRGLGEEETSTGTVSFEILPDVEIQSEVSRTQEGASANVGLRWRYDY